MARYSDPQLLAVLRKSARRINRVLNLTGTDEAIQIMSDGCITPDNPDLEDLVLLQAECIIASRDFQEELGDASEGLVVRDGEQTVDTTQSVIARGTFFNSPNSPCAELIEAIKLEKMNRAGDASRLVW